jgi:hypothetical protein
VTYENPEKILKADLITIAVLVLGLIGLIVDVIASDYKPDEKELIAKVENPSVLNDSLTISLLTWNIDYAGNGPGQQKKLTC